MAKFSLNLPFFVPLEEGPYTLNVDGHEFTVSHAIVRQENRDPRLGGVCGSFSFERDQLGLLRFSQLSAELNDDDLRSVRRALLGGSKSDPSTWSLQTKGQAGLALFNQFLDRYRAATRNRDIRPVRTWDLSNLYFDDGQSNADLRLYGGGIALPVAGLTSEYRDHVIRRFAESNAPASYELGALDALQAVEDGGAGSALVLAAGALESAIDTYLSRSWRLGQPRVLPQEAANQLKVRGTRVRTIDDILETGRISNKTKIDPIKNLIDSAQAGAILDKGLEMRNLVVHGGVRIPLTKARQYVEGMSSFILDHLATTIEREYPRLPQPEFLYAYEEALGTVASPEIQDLTHTYLVGAGLTARLYYNNDNDKRHNMYSERHGDTLVIRIAFQDFKTEQVNLFVGRAFMNYWLEQRDDMAFARTAVVLPDEAARPFWSKVASEMTRAVWGAAIDRRLAEHGLRKAVQQEIKRQASALRQRYSTSYVPPPFEQLGYWIDYLELARVAVGLPAPERTALLDTIARVAPKVTQRANLAIPTMEHIDFDAPASILRTLIAIHDAHEGILATVPIYDPATHKEYGLGLNFEDIGQIRKMF